MGGNDHDSTPAAPGTRTLSYFGRNRVELIQPLEGPSVYHDFVDKHGYGYFAYLDTEDAFGVTYELIERPARRVEAEKTYPE